jgi:sec-independent protein translocase protein TatA
MGLENPLHIAVLVVVLLLVFGAKRIPEMARALGSSMSEFRAGLDGGVATTPPAASPGPAPVVQASAAAPTGGAPSVAPPEPDR